MGNIKIFYIAILLTFCAGCNNQSPVESNNVDNTNQGTSAKYIHKVTLLFGSAIFADTLFADSAQVTVDDTLRLKTDYQGILNIDSLLEGSHKITVKHSLFSNYSQTINVQANNIFISLVPLVEDYFPLKIGAKWKYRFSYSMYVSGEGGNADSGLVTWTITERKWDNSEKEFLVKANYQKTALNSGISPQTDSTSFTIIESNNHRLSIELIDSSSNRSYFLCRELQSMLVQDTVFRYYPNTNNDRIHFYALTDGGAGTNVYIKKNSGVSSYGYSFQAGMSWGYFIDYNLVLFDLP